MENQEIIQNQFLTDKEWWIEETEREYILFVKHNGKTYQSSKEKARIRLVKELNDEYLKKSAIALLIADIKLKINEDKINQLKYEWK